MGSGIPGAGFIRWLGPAGDRIIMVRRNVEQEPSIPPGITANGLVEVPKG